MDRNLHLALRIPTKQRSDNVLGQHEQDGHEIHGHNLAEPQYFQNETINFYKTTCKMHGVRACDTDRHVKCCQSKISSKSMICQRNLTLL